jgi:hypothetical protein
MSTLPFAIRYSTALEPPCSVGLSALAAGVAVFLTDMDLDLLGYGLLGLAVLLLLHAGLNIACRDAVMVEAAVPARENTHGRWRNSVSA